MSAQFTLLCLLYASDLPSYSLNLLQKIKEGGLFPGFAVQ